MLTRKQAGLLSLGVLAVLFGQSQSTLNKDTTTKKEEEITLMQEVVLTASRGEAIKRAEAPVAIATITPKMIQDTKASMADQLLNKISGVNMVNLGNEQHQMSIRQPMTTRSLFLYLEDGIPVRTSGLYNHNALLEMNLAAVKSIEVIKGPSSSLYGSEAIGGVVNFITVAPAADPLLKFSVQGNDIGYKRADIQAGFRKGRSGFGLNGYYANKKNGYLEYSDFHKGTISFRFDHAFSAATALTNTLTVFDYYSDMAGGLDSAMFASRKFTNPQTFTYRKVNGVRFHSTLTHSWNEKSRSSITAVFRDNSIGQNPAYRVKDDYRKVNGVFTGKKDLAHGEINDNSFRSFSLIAQHRQRFAWKNALLSGGFNLDLSPSTYAASYIRIKKDTLTRKYISYQPTDSVLTDYATKLNNYAGFLNFEFSPFKGVRFVGSLRYDRFTYRFDNHLRPSAFSGSADTLSHFNRVSPKLGMTWNFTRNIGLYANYSEGFVPPQVTELYTGVKVPSLTPSVFYNYEAGGWFSIWKDRLSADLSLYQLKGTQEIISVKLDDGSFANRNAGRTIHQGIEMGLRVRPAKGLLVRFSAAVSEHRFIQYVEKGISYNGREMANAPHWIHNTEISWKPGFIKGYRIGLEWQKVGAYFMDPQNSTRYEGYDALHLRMGYEHRSFEIWLNILNATNNYYSYISSKSAFGYSYQLAEPRNVNLGISYDLASLFKKNKSL